MNRKDLQTLANTRIREANILFEAGEYSGAYYLAGYAVECALKACFAKNTQRYDFPDRSTANRVFTHKLEELIKFAKLDVELRQARDDSEKLSAAWDLVLEWNEESRYFIWTRSDAEEILRAIVGRKDGVLPWIKRRW